MAGIDPFRSDWDIAGIGDRPPGKGRLPETGPVLIGDTAIRNTMIFLCPPYGKRCKA